MQVNGNERENSTDLKPYLYTSLQPIPVAMRSKAWVCGRSLAGSAGSNPAEVWSVALSGRSICVELSLVQRSPTECAVSECDSEASIIRPWPTMGYGAMEKNTSFT
jgi:hypothetical protein